LLEYPELPAIIQIPSTSEYTADLVDMKNFLNDLYFKKDFIIVGYLEMQGPQAREFIKKIQEERGVEITVDDSLGNLWSMKVTFEKYQFSKGFNSYIETNYVPIDSEPDEEVLNFIRERYGS